MPADAVAKPAIDWERVEAQYRAGVLSVREIARQASCSDPLIRKHAKQHGWQRDLSARVRQAARTQAARELGTGDIAGDITAPDHEIVQTAAACQVAVVREHRDVLRVARDLGRRLLHELAASTSHIGEIEDLIETEPGSELADQKRRDGMLRAVSLGSRTGQYADLAAAIAKWIPLDRTAFAIDAKPGEGSDEATSLSAEDAKLRAEWEGMDHLQKARAMGAWVEQQMVLVREQDAKAAETAAAAGATIIGDNQEPVT